MFLPNARTASGIRVMPTEAARTLNPCNWHHSINLGPSAWQAHPTHPGRSRSHMQSVRVSVRSVCRTFQREPIV